MKGLVSIIIPAYNAEPFLAETIRSVLSQSWNEWELFIVNDGSKDRTEEIAKSFAADPRIHVISQSNAGVSAARNAGIEAARGEYIAFLDADDAWERDNLEKKIKALESPGTDFVFSDRYLADEKMNRLGIGERGKEDNIAEDILLWEGEVIPGPCCNILMKRKCIDSGLRFDTALSTAADQDFSLRLAAQFKGKYLREPLWTYRIVPGSMSRNIRLMEEDHIKVYRKAERNKMFRSFMFRQQCFSNLYLVLAGSWWVDGGNKPRGLYFMLLSVINYPPNIFKLLKKLLK